MSGVKGRSGGRRPRAALPACPRCGRRRASRLRNRFETPTARVEHYCRSCQARSGRAWRDRNPIKVAGYRLARRSS